MTGPLAAVVVLTLAQAPAPPAQNCRSVKGKFLAHLVSPPACPAGSLCTAGDLTGDLKGTYEFHVTRPPVDAGAPAPTSVKFFVGESRVKLKKGGTINGVDTGTIDMPPGRGGFASLITWTQGAAGQIRLRGMLTPAGTTGEYAGDLCTPR